MTTPPHASMKTVGAAEETSSRRSTMDSEAPPPSYDAIEHDTNTSDFQFIRPQPRIRTQTNRNIRPPVVHVPETKTPSSEGQGTGYSASSPKPPASSYCSDSPSSQTQFSTENQSTYSTPSTKPTISSHSSTYSTSSQSQTLLSSEISSTPSSSHSSQIDRRSASSSHITPVFTPKKHGWFGGKKKTVKEAREWVTGHVNDLVRQTHSYDFDACCSILAGCSEACAMTPQLNVSDILQERSVDEHTPFYWAIVHRPVSSSYGVVPDLLAALLEFGSPLTEETRKDVRQACLMVNDQTLFQCLRSSSKFIAPPKKQTIPELENGRRAFDNVEVQEIPGAEAVFRVDFEIPQFLRRMLLEEEVSLEFIAHRRAWQLLFKPSSKSKPTGPLWDLVLSLSEHSSPTYVDSQFSILKSRSESPPPLPPNKNDLSPARNPRLASPSMPNLTQTSRANGRNNRPQVVDTISISRTLDSTQPPLMVALKSTSMISPGKREISVSLEDACGIGLAIRLQKSAYIGPNETLKARLEARLAKPDPESSCIIC